MTASPTTLVIYSITFLVRNLLGTDFLPTKSSHGCENKAVLGPDCWFWWLLADIIPFLSLVSGFEQVFDYRSC